MCAPVTAALFLAALSALPCGGTDAGSGLKLNENTNKSEITPTVNKIFQMLYKSNLKINGLSNKPNYTDSNLDTDLIELQTVNANTTSSVSDEKFHKGANVVVSVKTVNVKNVNVKNVNVKRAVSVVRTEAKESFLGIMTSTPGPERRRKTGESGSSAPLLNYIFDTYSNTHQHTNNRQVSGNSIYAAAAPEVKALVGSTAQLDCKVDALHDKLVSWVRRKNEEEQMELLTTGTQQYTADDRYSARFIPPDIWRLEVRDVRPADAANYDCQLSAHPPRTARVTLRVPDVSVRIVDGAGADVSEQVCEEGSTVALRCEVRGLRMEGGPALLWYRKEDLLNDDTTRGGISVRTEFGANGANSVLRVARVRADDAGRYTCRVGHSQPVVLPPAHVLLHVIKGESLAELHQGTGSRADFNHFLVTAMALFVIQCTL